MTCQCLIISDGTFKQAQRVQQPGSEQLRKDALELQARSKHNLAKRFFVIGATSMTQEQQNILETVARWQPQQGDENQTAVLFVCWRRGSLPSECDIQRPYPSTEKLRVREGDIDALWTAGLLSKEYSRPDVYKISVTATGLRYLQHSRA